MLLPREAGSASLWLKRALRLRRRAMRPPSLALLLPLLQPARVVGDISFACQIFDETMVCDNEKARLHRAEIRTCSG